MTREEALKKTSRKYTNLFDGHIIPNVNVETIIKYYEALLDDKTPQTKEPLGNIEKKFQDESFKNMK